MTLVSRADEVRRWYPQRVRKGLRANVVLSGATTLSKDSVGTDAGSISLHTSAEVTDVSGLGAISDVLRLPDPWDALRSLRTCF